MNFCHFQLAFDVELKITCIPDQKLYVTETSLNQVCLSVCIRTGQLIVSNMFAWNACVYQLGRASMLTMHAAMIKILLCDNVDADCSNNKSTDRMLSARTTPSMIV